MKSLVSVSFLLGSAVLYAVWHGSWPAAFAQYAMLAVGFAVFLWPSRPPRLPDPPSRSDTVPFDKAADAFWREMEAIQDRRQADDREL